MSACGTIRFAEVIFMLRSERFFCFCHSEERLQGRAAGIEHAAPTRRLSFVSGGTKWSAGIGRSFAIPAGRRLRSARYRRASTRGGPPHPFQLIINNWAGHDALLRAIPAYLSFQRTAAGRNVGIDRCFCLSCPSILAARSVYPPCRSAPRTLRAHAGPSFAAAVHKMFIGFLRRRTRRRQKRYLCKQRMTVLCRRRMRRRDEKGTPVQIRDYPRSCNFHAKAAQSPATAASGRREGVPAGTSQKTCRHPFVRSFRVEEFDDTAVARVRSPAASLSSDRLHLTALQKYSNISGAPVRRRGFPFSDEGVGAPAGGTGRSNRDCRRKGRARASDGISASASATYSHPSRRTHVEK